jgi:hypothetical protein
MTYIYMYIVLRTIDIFFLYKQINN